MKLDNKGFAISSIMYLILILALILVSITLAVLENRRIILDKLKDEALNSVYGYLPKEYQKVEYIEGQGIGAQYIDTGYSVVGSDDYKLVVYGDFTTGNSSAFMGEIHIF